MRFACIRLTFNKAVECTTLVTTQNKFWELYEVPKLKKDTTKQSFWAFANKLFIKIIKTKMNYNSLFDNYTMLSII